MKHAAILKGHPIGVGMAEFFRLTLLVTAIALSACQAPQETCSGHGHKEGNACVCENPRPLPGDKGWTGRYCEIEVYGAFGDGEDETTRCASEMCNSLEPDTMRCWSLTAPWNSRVQPWNFLSIQLNRTSQSGDPDLYGIFWGDDNEEVNSRLEDLRASVGGFDFKETSSSLHPLVNYVVDKERDFGLQHDYSGVLMCIHAYGSSETSFSLAASTTLCPSLFNQKGELTMCSSPSNGLVSERRYDQCVDGKCVCRDRWQKPTPSVYEGLGFDDCSAEVESVPDTPYKFYPDKVLDYKDWTFFKFNVTSHDFEVLIRATSWAQTKGQVNLFLKSGTPPSNRFGQFDTRSMSETWSSKFDQAEIRLSKALQTDHWRLGTWYAGIHNLGNKGRYIVEVARYGCPSNCNGRGVCNYDDHTCNCSEGYFGDSCSGFHQHLEFDRQVVTPQPQEFENAFFKLPEVTSDQAGHVEMTVSAQAWQGTSLVPEIAREWGGAMPVLLLKGSNQDDDFPSVSNYTMKQELLQANNSYSITIASSQAKTMKWTALIYNPAESIPIGYKLVVSKQAFCPNSCTSSDRGTCAEDGSCVCKPGWLGLDCSISSSSCIEGSYNAERRDEDHGTCFHQCACQDGRCGFERMCHYFVCFDAEQRIENDGQNQLKFRKIADEDRCVLEEPKSAPEIPTCSEEQHPVQKQAIKHTPPPLHGRSPALLVGLGLVTVMLSLTAGSAGTVIFLRRRGQLQSPYPRHTKLYEGIDMADLAESSEELLISTSP